MAAGKASVSYLVYLNFNLNFKIKVLLSIILVHTLCQYFIILCLVIQSTIVFIACVFRKKKTCFKQLAEATMLL